VATGEMPAPLPCPGRAPPSPRFDGLAAQPFSDCSFRSPHFTPLCPVRRPSSSQAAQLARSWGLSGETRHLQSPQTSKDCKAPSPGCRILRLQVARGVHECAYMPHRYFICTCKTITTQPGVSGDGELWAGGRRAYQSEEPDPLSEPVAVAFPSGPGPCPRAFASVCLLDPLLGVHSAQKWAHASWGWFGLPTAPDLRQPHSAHEGCCTLRGPEIFRLESRPPAQHLCVAPVDWVSGLPSAE
jgi:hypothetical protein